ncbi:MAG: glycosyltransferase family 39 protein [Verrucomicrobia bacterium]|nr:glycosyltransferase family 39 protein [Verrucomicrobiota bacterium]
MTGSTRRRYTVGLLLVLFACFRAFYIYHARIDSDEPQHLHVAWGWTQGFLQYRDVFDNHTPLFHLLLAPLVSLAGERADIVVVMRWAMVPLFLLSLFCTWQLGRVLYSMETAIWAAMITAFSPKFFFVAGQFRSDDLWVALWLMTLVVLVHPQLSWTRSLGAGVLIGAAVAASLKTVLLLFALLGALVAVLVMRRIAGRSTSLARIGLLAISAAAGAMLIPGVIVLFYVHEHALGRLLYGAVFHNYVPRLGHWKHHGLQLLFVPELVVLGLLAALLFRTAPSIEAAGRRVFVILSAGIYLALLVSFWPLLAPESFLPVYPIASLAIAGFVCFPLATTSSAAHRLRGQSTRGSSRGHATLLAIAAVEILAICLLSPPWINGTVAEEALLHDVLRLTTRADYVMDGKGETVFRRRPFYPIFEHITRNRIGLHLIEDSLVRDLVRTRTCVVTSFHPFKQSDIAFIRQNYVPVGPLSVAGKFISLDDASLSAEFTVQIPAQYAIIAQNGAFRGQLDDQPYSAPRFLGAGPHRVLSTSGRDCVAIVWSRAIERGYSPFKVAPWSIPVLY